MIGISTTGLLSGMARQAALNPAVSVIDYAVLLIAFLYSAMTNLIAATRSTDRHMPDVGRCHAARVTFASPLLRAIIGYDAFRPAVFDAAMRYVRARALGMPAAAVVGCAQAACLVMQDIRSPLIVLAIAVGVNFVEVIFLLRARIRGLEDPRGQQGRRSFRNTWLAVCRKPKHGQGNLPPVN
jgi:Na+-driven multidrug efflux pump